MLALLALVCFAVAFVLRLVGTDLGHFDLVVLGLAFMAADAAYPFVVRRPRP